MRILHEAKQKERVEIESEEGVKVVPIRKREKKVSPHLNTGFKVKCLACKGEHDLDMIGPWWYPKLWYRCNEHDIGMFWPSSKAQKLIRESATTPLSDETMEELKVKMRETFAPSDKKDGKYEKRKLKFIEKGSHVRETPGPKPRPEKVSTPGIDRGLLDALRDRL